VWNSIVSGQDPILLNRPVVPICRLTDTIKAWMVLFHASLENQAAAVAEKPGNGQY
jgi:hypothetical protein